MADDKRTDEKMEQGRAYEAPPLQLQLRHTPSSGPSAALSNNPILPVLAYCGSSIMMTVMNKYVLSGLDFNLNFFLLLVQVRWLSVWWL
jgi:GDP-mannose transporter